MQYRPSLDVLSELGVERICTSVDLSFFFKLDDFVFGIVSFIGLFFFFSLQIGPH